MKKGDGMSAMKSHPRYHSTLEDLFLRVFVLVDDWLKANEGRFRLPKQPRQIASYSELLTIALVGELLAQPYESIWYWQVQQNHQALFPSLPAYSRYHRIVRHARALWAELASALSMSLSEETRLIDAKPLPVAKGKRAQWAKCPEAAKGFSTMGMVYGFKLHALVNARGLFERWSFAPANVAEVSVAASLTAGLESCLIVGDKGYIGHPSIITPKRKNMKDKSCWNKSLSRLRKRIETSFSVLVRSLTLHAAQVKTFWSLQARVNLKIAAHNLIHSGLL